MHNHRPRTGHAPASALRAYMDKLVNSLDDSTLRATLLLMISETRRAIHKQRRLIALERLDGRDTTGRFDELRDLEAAQVELITNSAEYTANNEVGVSVRQ